MTDRRTQTFKPIRNRRTRLLDRRQNEGPFRFLFIPISDFFLRFVWGGL